MRLIKLAFISFIVFFGIITAMSLLIPSHIRISKAVSISRTDSVFYLINNVDQWPRWHPAFHGLDAGTALQASHITVTPVQKNDSLVSMSWQQAGKTPVLNTWELHRFGETDSVALQWYMDFHLKWYPWQKFNSLLYEKTYGTMMEQGLNNIKRILQQKVS